MTAERKGWWIGGGVALLLLSGVVGLAVSTGPVRGAVSTYHRLLDAANRQDVAAAVRLCSARYLAGHTLVASDEGGIIGLPRNIHKNFQAWREGAEVWLCPSNRLGPVYRLVREEGDWKFDGPVGLLGSGGEMTPMSEDGLPPLKDAGSGS
ncbi:hypothetical protein EP7_003965 [Isosphaeraceae bacterium EP7]